MFTTFLVTALSHASIAALAQWWDPSLLLPCNFDRIDANGDGVTPRPEYLTARVSRWPQLDSNGDGYLTEDDFPHIALKQARTQLAEIASPDTNDNDRISRDKFLIGLVPLFHRADLKADDVLTRSKVDVAAS